jgi:dienelactone hydrolase
VLLFRAMRGLVALLVACTGLVSPAWAQSGKDVTVPLTVKGLFGDKTVNLAATEYRPDGDGRFPAIVISHGSPVNAGARAGYTGKYAVASGVFVQWGFVVLNPLRRGYGKTGGAFEEDYGRCESPFFVEGGLESARDIAAAVAYLRQQPFVDADRIVLVGTSAGGWGSLAAASRGDLPIRGVVSFAGGRGGKHNNVPNNNCSPDRLIAAAGTYGKTTKVPSLWLYAANDLFFGPELSRRMYEAYTAAGARATYESLPAIGNDGHQLISMQDGVPLWKEKVEAFLREIGVLPAR